MSPKRDTEKDHDATMARDTTYLRLRGNCWQFDYRVPVNFQRFFKTDRLRYSLNTPDYKQARYLRDKYLIPVLAATSIVELLENLKTAVDQSQLELNEHAAELKAFLHSGDVEHRIKLNDLCQRFSKAYHCGGFSEASQAKLDSSIFAITTVLGGDTVAEQIDRKQIVILRDALLKMPINWQTRTKTQPTDETRTLSPKTVKIHLSYLKRIFTWGIAEGLLKVQANPVDGIDVILAAPKLHKRPPNPNELQALCSLPLPRTESFSLLTWRSLPLFGRYTGCRIGEISQLTAEDVIVKNGVRCLQITALGDGKRLKTESSERLVPVSDKLVPQLDAVLAERKTGPLFPDCGHRYGRDGKTIYKAAHGFVHAYNRAAKKVAQDQSFHCWRAYANTQMIDAGVDILDREAILGHKSDRVQKAYTADNLIRWKNAIERIE